MKKICIKCGEEWNDWFMKLLGFIFRDQYDFKCCQECRDKRAIKEQMIIQEKYI